MNPIQPVRTRDKRAFIARADQFGAVGRARALVRA